MADAKNIAGAKDKPGVKKVTGQKERQGDRRLPIKNALEWAVFAISLLLVLGVIAYLAYSALTTQDRPPDLAVELGEVAVGDGGLYQVPVTVRNRGGSTTEEVAVEVALEVEGRPEETVEIVIPLVPYQSSVEGVATFRSDPRQGQLSARVMGYLKP